LKPSLAQFEMLVIALPLMRKNASHTQATS
jgi:hypothetical protein